MSFHFQIWQEEFGEFLPKHWKIQKFHFDELFSSKVSEVWAKKIQRSYPSWHWTAMQNLNKPWPFDFKNGMRNWVNFHYSAQNYEKLYIEVLFLCKAYNVSARKFPRDYVSWHWRVTQDLKEKWLVVWKMTYEIWLIFMRAVESLKICTLIGSFCPKHIKIQTKKYGRVMFHDTEEWCKVWRKTDSWFQKRHEKFAEFLPKHSKVQKFHFDALFLSRAYEVWA